VTNMQKSNRLKGAIHIHSNYSNDGKSSLEELAQKARELHYDFLAITDHFEDLDDYKLNELLHECKRLSDFYRFNMIPGVEVRLRNGAHVLVIGINSVLKQFSIDNIESLQKAAREQCALIGLAHLSYEPNLSLTDLLKFDFIEGWNHRYDRNFPSLRAFRTTHVLRNNCFTGGIDLHSIDELGSIWLETGESNIIDGIRNKKIITKNNFLEVDQNGHIKNGKLFFFVFFWISITLQQIDKLALKFVFLNRKPPQILKKFRTILG
jgi:hypothetical protein